MKYEELDMISLGITGGTVSSGTPYPNVSNFANPASSSVNPTYNGWLRGFQWSIRATGQQSNPAPDPSVLNVVMSLNPTYNVFGVFNVTQESQLLGKFIIPVQSEVPIGYRRLVGRNYDNNRVLFPDRFGFTFQKGDFLTVSAGYEPFGATVPQYYLSINFFVKYAK